MQATRQTEPVTAPAAPTPPTITVVGADGQTQTLVAPRTQEEVSQLLSRRSEISDQLSNVSARRRALSEEIRSAPDGASRTGLEGRLKVMDERIIQLESDLASTGRQLAAAPSELKAFSEVAQNSGGDDFEGGFAVGGFTVLGATLLVWFFRRWRAKRRGPAPRREIMAESDPRMERIERGMEAIAVEVERISEGQRFVTKLMAETRAPEVAQLENSRP